MTEQKQVKVWDPLVRIFHWSLVVAFFVAYFTEDELLDLHVLAGYTVAGLVAFRLVWGLVGPRHARFSDFVYPPGEVFGYLGDLLRSRARRYLGHSPAGGAMVIALLAMLVVVSISGVAVYALEEGAGPLAPWLAGGGEELEDVVEEIHEIASNLTLVLVILHIAGVLLSSRVHGENLVRAMFTGYKKAD